MLGWVHALEVGRLRWLTQLVPWALALAALAATYDFYIFRGLNDGWSMDNAQVARQIARGEGYTTRVIRPLALYQVQHHRIATGALPATAALFAPEYYPASRPRVLPDTYNPPVYPYLLALVFKLVHPVYDLSAQELLTRKIYPPERWIPLLNQALFLGTTLLAFILALRTFDGRVAWVTVAALLGCDLLWQYTLTAWSTHLLMFAVTALLLLAQEIARCGATPEARAGRRPALVWALGLGSIPLLGLIFLSRLNLALLILPVAGCLALGRPRRPVLAFVVALGALALVVPWLLRNARVSGSWFGSGEPFVLWGLTPYLGNEIFGRTALPENQLLFGQVLEKQIDGFRWHLEHGYTLLGASPFVLLFAVSFLHPFRRARAQALRTLVLAGSLGALVAGNLIKKDPAALDVYNCVIVFLPGMFVLGAAYLFVLIDRLDLVLPFYERGIAVFVLLLHALPLGFTLLAPQDKLYNYPPYVPAYLDQVGRLAKPDEWVTSDMPWATAWYADQPSLLLPDSLGDFEIIHDQICPTGILLLTPVLFGGPYQQLTNGEYRDWFPLVTRSNIPPLFPLKEVTVPNNHLPDYQIWSDRPRWSLP